MSAQVPRVAVCLAAYNGMLWLPAQIKSIQEQVDVDVAIFVSVDLSTDDTMAYALSLAQKNQYITVLPYGMRFGGAAGNFFRLLSDVDFSNFNYIAFADQDDIWYPDKMIRAVNMLQTHQSDGYSSNVTAFWDDGRRFIINKAQPQTKWDFLFESAGPGCTFVMRPGLVHAVKACIALNHHAISGVGLHDWFVYAFARANGFKWFIDDYSGLLYRQHAHNQVGVNRGLRAYFFRASKVLTGWGLNQSLLIARLIGLSGNPFVVKWAGGGAGGLLWLAFRARECRRRSRDQIFFAISCLVLAVFGGLR